MEAGWRVSGDRLSGEGKFVHIAAEKKLVILPPEHRLLSPCGGAVGLPEVEKGEGRTWGALEPCPSRPCRLPGLHLEWRFSSSAPGWEALPQTWGLLPLPDWYGAGPSLRGDPAELESEFLPLCCLPKAFFGPRFLNWIQVSSRIQAEKH